MIERMTMEDVDGVLEHIYPSYFKEGATSYLTPCYAHARKTVENYVSGHTFVAKEDGKIVGLCVAIIGHSFYVEPEWDVNMFYILPEYRGTGLSRKLIAEAIKAGKDAGCRLFYTSCLGGIEGDNEQLYINLWKKFGFERLGTVMYRGIK